MGKIHSRFDHAQEAKARTELHEMGQRMIRHQENGPYKKKKNAKLWHREVLVDRVLLVPGRRFAPKQKYNTKDDRANVIGYGVNVINEPITDRTETKEETFLGVIPADVETKTNPEVKEITARVKTVYRANPGRLERGLIQFSKVSSFEFASLDQWPGVLAQVIGHMRKDEWEKTE